MNDEAEMVDMRVEEQETKGSRHTVNSFGIGWVFEVVWHVVFSMEAV